jgi:hypothetical protein
MRTFGGSEGINPPTNQCTLDRRQWCQQFGDGHTSLLDDARAHTAVATVNLRLRAPGPRPLQSWPGTQRLPLPPMKMLKQPSVPRTLTFTNRGSSSSRSSGTNASMSVGTMFKNIRLMPCSAHIGVYLVRAVSCRRRNRETYFPTTPRSSSVSDKINPWHDEYWQLRKHQECVPSCHGWLKEETSFLLPEHNVHTHQ